MREPGGALSHSRLSARPRLPDPPPAVRRSSFLSRAQEVREGLRRRGIAVSSAQLSEVFKELDADKDNRVSRAEFERFCVSRREQIAEVFRGFDRDADGRVSSDELRRGVERAGLKISDDQLRVAFEILDQDGDGILTQREFERVLTLLPRGANAAAAFDKFVHRAFVDDAESEYTVPRDLDETTFTKELVAKLLSGGVAGAVSRTATAPIDRLKTILQTGRLPKGLAKDVYGDVYGDAARAASHAAASTSSEPKTKTKTKSKRKPASGGKRAPTLREAARAVYREGGARAFWRGNGANVLKVVPETAVKFAAFDALKQVVAEDPGNATTGERFVAGGVAGAAAQAAIYPLEIVKTRMALSSNAAHPKAAPTTITGVFRSVLNESGARGLFRGLAPSLVGIVPYAGIDLMTNSTLREYVTRQYQAAGAEPGIAELLGCGMASSTTAMLATYPLNVIRTRMQTGGMPGFPAYESASDCFLDVVRREGPRGLYRGIAPSLAKVLPASSISYAVYDTLSAERR